MVETVSGAPLFAAGCVTSCGALLVLAGASKLYRAARGATGATAIGRALRMTPRQWRRAEPAAGALECAVGGLVCAGAYPAAGAVMAALGAVFCGLLGYARVTRLPGGCGCIGWRAAAGRGAQRVSRTEIARSAMLLAAGAVGATLPPSVAGAVTRAWFAGGMLAGGAMLTLLSQRTLPRTPVCRRPVWRPARAAMRALTGHSVFAAMAESAGPLGPVTRRRRTGCADEFWFSLAHRTGGAGDRHTAVVFRIWYPAVGGTPAVHARIAEGER